MAELGNMKLVLGADVADLLAGMKRSEKSLNDFKNQADKFREALKTATDPQRIVTLNRAIESASNKMKMLQSAGTNASGGLNRVNDSANRAGSTMTDFNRIVSDAPFGIMGIANNITPLIDNFARLKSETGGTGNALKAMFSSLAGPQGLAIGLTLVTTALTFAQMGFGAWTRGLGGSAKAIDENKKSLEDFNKSLADAKSGAMATGLQLQSFVDIARDGNKPLSQRNYAIEQANKLLGEHGEKLDLTNINTNKATDAVNNYTNALIQQAVAQQYTNRIADLILKQTEALKLFTLANKESKKASDGFNASISNQANIGAFAKGTVAISGAVDQEKRAMGERNLTAKNYYDITNQISQSKEELNKSTSEAARLFGLLGNKTNETGKKLKNEKDVLADLDKEIIKLNTSLSSGFINQDEFTKGFIGAYKKAIEEIASININSSNIPMLQAKIMPVLLKDAMKELKDNIVKDDADIEVPVTIVPSTNNVDGAMAAQGAQVLRNILEQQLRNSGVKLDLPLNLYSDEKLKEFLATRQEQIANFANFAATNLSQPFTALFDTIANGGGNAFQAFGDSLKRIITRMLAAAATAALLSAIIGPFLGGASSATQTAFSFKGLFSSLSGLKLADGGLVSGKGSSRADMIPAMLSNNEYVMNAAAVNRIGVQNLDRLNNGANIGGGMAITVDVVGQMRGQNIYFANQRAAQTINRNG